MFSVIFPGQGSQAVGMGNDFYKKFNIVKELFDEADDILGFSIKKLILTLRINIKENNRPHQGFGIFIEPVRKISFC